MKLSIPVIVLLSALWAGNGAQGPNGLLSATFSRMDAAAARFKGLTADVKKVSHTEVINENNVESGALMVKRPKPRDLEMLIELKQPDAKKVWFGDHKAMVFYPKANTVQIYDVGKKYSALAEQFLLLGFGSTSADIQSGYTVKLGGEETINGQKTVRLELTPKSRDVLGDFTKVELWISQAPDTSGIAMQQKLYERGGDYLMTTYANMRVNPSLPDLKLDLPKDVIREHPVR